MKDSTATLDEQPETYIDGLGRREGTVFFDRLGHRRVVTAPEFYDDDGNLVATGAEATAAFAAHVDEQQVKRQAALHTMPAKVRRAYVTYLRTGRLPEARARAPREARNDRLRGSRRGQRATSSSSDDPEPEPPGRICVCGCGRDISHRAAQARYVDDRHAAADRQRRKRDRDRPKPEPLDEPRAATCTCTPGGTIVYREDADLVCFDCGRPRAPVMTRWVNGHDVPRIEGMPVVALMRSTTPPAHDVHRGHRPFVIRRPRRWKPATGRWGAHR